MTNTLKSGFKLIQLTKLNTNLLSVISLVVLCTMIFLTVSAIARHDCEDKKKEYEAAKKTLEAVQEDYELAEILYAMAVLTGNPVLVILVVLQC